MRSTMMESLTINGGEVGEGSQERSNSIRGGGSDDITKAEEKQRKSVLTFFSL